MIFNIDRFQFFAMHCMKTIFCWKGDVTTRPRTFFSGIIRLIDYASPILPIPDSGRGTEKEQFNYIYLCGTCFTVMAPVRQENL